MSHSLFPSAPSTRNNSRNDNQPTPTSLNRKRRPHSPPPPPRRPSSLTDMWTWMRTRSCPAISADHEAQPTSPHASNLQLPTEALHYMNIYPDSNARFHPSLSTLDSLAAAGNRRKDGDRSDEGSQMANGRVRSQGRMVTFEDAGNSDGETARNFTDSTGVTVVGVESEKGECEDGKPKRYRGINEKDWLKRALRRVVRKFKRRFR